MNDVARKEVLAIKDDLLLTLSYPSDKAFAILKDGKSPEAQRLIDAARVCVEPPPPAKGKSPAECLDEVLWGGSAKIDNGIALLREYADKHRPENKLPEDLLEKELAQFEAYYQTLRPRISAQQLADFDAEYEAIRKFRFAEEKTWMAAFEAYFALGAGAFNLAFKVGAGHATHFSHLNLMPTVLFFSDKRFYAGQERPLLTPEEERQLAFLQFLADGTLTLAFAVPTAKPESPGKPQEAPEPDYTQIGPFNLPNTGWRYVLNPIFDQFQADSLGSISQQRLLLAGTRHTGPLLLSNAADAALDVGKLMLVSPRLEEVRGDMARTETLTAGRDGDECSAASDAEVEYFRVSHPEHADLSDEEIMKLICSARPNGSNEPLTAAKRGNDTMAWNRLTRAYLLTAYHRNLSLTDEGGAPRLISALLLAGAQPVLNQVAYGKEIDSGQLGTDYLLEAAAATATVLSHDEPELRYPMGLALQQMVDALSLPDFYLRHSQHFLRDDDVKFPSLSEGMFLLGFGFDAPVQYLAGVEHGDMFRKGLNAAAVERWQYFSPALAGLTAHAIRKGRFYFLMKPDAPNIEGLSDSQAESLQEPYEYSRTGWATAAEWSALGLYVLGLGVGVLTSDGRRESTTEEATSVRGGPFSARIAGVDLNLNLAPGAVLVSGTF